MKPVKFTSTVSGASFFIASFGLLSKSIGFLREILFASIYGLSTEFDIYLVGAVFPLTINVIIMSLGQNYIIPAYNKFKEIDKDTADNFIRYNFYIFILIGIIISTVFFLLSDSIISLFVKNSDPLLVNRTLSIFNLFLLTIPLSSAISVIIAYQQSKFEFKYSVMSSIIPNITVLISVFFYGSSEIIAIPIGFTIGIFLQLIFLSLKSFEVFSLGVKNSPSNHYKYIKNGFLSITVIVLIESIGQLYTVTDRYYFSSISEGGISALSYAQTIFLLPISILSIALSTAIFPKLSYLFNKKNFPELEKLLINGFIINIVIFIPVMFVLIFYGDTVLKLIYERGKFSNTDTLITSSALTFYSLSIVFYSAYSILNKMIYSIGLIKKLLLITIIGIAIKILFNLIFVGSYFQDGLALSTSISYMFFFISSLHLVYKHLKLKNRLFFFKELVLHFCMGIVVLFAVRLVILGLPQYDFITFLEIFIFLLIYLVSLFILKYSGLQIIVQLLKNIKISIIL